LTDNVGCATPQETFLHVLSVLMKREWLWVVPTLGLLHLCGNHLFAIWGLWGPELLHPLAVRLERKKVAPWNKRRTERVYKKPKMDSYNDWDWWMRVCIGGTMAFLFDWVPFERRRQMLLSNDGGAALVAAVTDHPLLKLLATFLQAGLAWWKMRGTALSYPTLSTQV
jgi:hypothetical protein